MMVLNNGQMGNPMINMTTQQLGTEYSDPNQVILHNQPYGQPYAQPYGQPYAQSYVDPYTQPVPVPYDQTGQAIFGQPIQGPPIYPPAHNYGPGPIVH